MQRPRRRKIVSSPPTRQAVRDILLPVCQVSQIFSSQFANLLLPLKVFSSAQKILRVLSWCQRIYLCVSWVPREDFPPPHEFYIPLEPQTKFFPQRQDFPLPCRTPQSTSQSQQISPPNFFLRRIWFEPRRKIFWVRKIFFARRKIFLQAPPTNSNPPRQVEFHTPLFCLPKLWLPPQNFSPVRQEPPQFFCKARCQKGRSKLFAVRRNRRKEIFWIRPAATRQLAWIAPRRNPKAPRFCS